MGTGPGPVCTASTTTVLAVIQYVVYCTTVWLMELPVCWLFIKWWMGLHRLWVLLCSYLCITYSSLSVGGWRVPRQSSKNEWNIGWKEIDKTKSTSYIQNAYWYEYGAYVRGGGGFRASIFGGTYIILYFGHMYIAVNVTCMGLPGEWCRPFCCHLVYCCYYCCWYCPPRQSRWDHTISPRGWILGRTWRKWSCSVVPHQVLLV